MSTTLVDLSTLVDLVLLDLPGCPRALALEGLRWAARELCRESGAWREKVAVETEAGVLQYALEAPTGALIHALTGLVDEDDEAVADGYSLEPPATLVLEDDPGEQTLEAECLCVPSGSEVPDWLADGYWDALQAGAKGMRQKDRGKPWSEPNLAGVNLAEFRRGAARLRQRHAGGFAGRIQTALQGVRV